MKENIREKLLSMGDGEYRDFSSKLIPNIEKSKIIGIRTPVLRSFAKSLSDYDDYLNELPHKY